MTASQHRPSNIEGTNAERLTFNPSLMPGGTFFFERDTGDLYILSISTLGVRSWVLVGGGGGGAVGGQLKYLVATQAPLQLGIFYPTVTAALAAAAGDPSDPAPIYVTPGTYAEPGPITLSRSVELIGMGETPEDVVLNFGAGGGAAITVAASHRLGIKNMTIQTSTNDSVVDFDGFSLEIDRVYLNATDNANTVDALRVAGGTFRLYRSEINNDSNSGQAANLVGGTINECEFSGVTAIQGGVTATDARFKGAVTSSADNTYRRCKFEGGSSSPLFLFPGANAYVDGCSAERSGVLYMVDATAGAATIHIIGRGFSDDVVSGLAPFLGPYHPNVLFNNISQGRTIRRQNIEASGQGPGALIGEVNGNTEYCRIVPDDGTPPNQYVSLCYANERADCSILRVKNPTGLGVDIRTKPGETFDDGSTSMTIGAYDYVVLVAIRTGTSAVWDVQ